MKMRGRAMKCGLMKRRRRGRAWYSRQVFLAHFILGASMLLLLLLLPAPCPRAPPPGPHPSLEDPVSTHSACFPGPRQSPVSHEWMKLYRTQSIAAAVGGIQRRHANC